MSREKTQTSVAAILLAAGKGTRMKSELPKVLHEAGDLPLVAWPMRAAREAGIGQFVVVVGFERERVEETVRAQGFDHVHFAFQAEQKGTGDAVRVGLEALPAGVQTVVVLNGDCPLVPTASLQALLEQKAQSDAPVALLTSRLADAASYGRMIRNEAGNVVAIREYRDCSESERAIHEVNPGVYAFDVEFLRQRITELSTDNAQGELYLTDLVEVAANTARVADAAWDTEDPLGVNDRYELSMVDDALRRRRNRELMEAGVTMREPDTIRVGPHVVVETDAVIEKNVSLRGRSHVAAGAHIDVGAVLDDTKVLAGAYVKPYTVASEATIGERTQVGPFAHLRPGTDLGPECKVGNFVEIKKTKFGKGSKASHLSYLGDGVLGDGVNVGAGTIFCNYDGVNKHVTTLEDGAFIGSDSQLVAPVTVGKNAFVATGTTVTQNVPEDALAIARTRQQNKEGYAAKLRKRFEAEKARRQK